MNTPWQVISLMEADNSRLVKEAIVAREAAANNIEFFDGCRLASDAMITFGLKQIKEKTDESGTNLDWDSFNNIAMRLRNRELTGHAARDAVDEMMAIATAEQWNGWYRRILIKDLRAGFSETTINKAVAKLYPQFVIPVFSCQLAFDSAKHEGKVSGKKIIEVKLDGVRVITIVYPSGKVDQFSRNGKELVNFPHVKEQLAKVAHHFTEPTVLDGEIMSSSFQDLMKQIRRKSNVKSADAVLNVFDIMPLSHFEKGVSTLTQLERSSMLIKWFSEHESVLSAVAVVGQEQVDLDTTVGYARYMEINTLAIAGGYEGVMLKDLNAPYECKRSVAWMKLKPFIEVSLTAVAVEEGTGKNVGKMGAVVFEGTDDGKFIRVSCGGGWSDKDREDIWASQTTVIGQVGEIRADAATLNQDSTDVYSLRFPRFKTWRGFVPGEKI
jgi:DNA ligase-1